MKRPPPSSLASALRAFLTDYLPQQRALSRQTSYATVGNPTWCVASGHTD